MSPSNHLKNGIPFTKQKMTDEYFAQKFVKELRDTMPAWKAWYEKILQIGKSNF